MTARIAGGPGAAGRLLIACPDACGIVAAVTSDHKTPAPIAAQARVGFHHCPITEAGKAGQEPQVPGILREARADCIERTRSMQVLSQGTPGLLRRCEHRIINIHHSFLPAFAGFRPLPPGIRPRREDHRRHQPSRHRDAR